MENHERKVTVVSDFILNSVKKIDIRKTLIKEKLKKKSFCGNLLIKWKNILRNIFCCSKKKIYIYKSWNFICNNRMFSIYMQEKIYTELSKNSNQDSNLIIQQS